MQDGAKIEARSTHAAPSSTSNFAMAFVDAPVMREMARIEQLSTTAETICIRLAPVELVHTQLVLSAPHKVK